MTPLTEMSQIGQGADLKPFVTMFLNARELAFSETTEQTYRYALRQFENYRLERNQPPLTDLLVKQYVRHLNWKRRSAAYIQRQLSVLRSFSAWAVEQNILPSDPTKNIPLPKLSQECRREALTSEEFEKLLSTVEIKDLFGLRDYLLISLILRTGTRLVELHRASIEDYVRKGESGLLYVHGKGREERDSFVILVSDLTSAMDRYVALRGIAAAQSPLFISNKPSCKGSRLSVRGIQTIITSYLKKAGIKRKRLTAYSLRHTAATEALANGADLKAVKEMMRHKSMNTTEKYVHLVRRVEGGAENYIKVKRKADLSKLQ